MELRLEFERWLIAHFTVLQTTIPKVIEAIHEFGNDCAMVGRDEAGLQLIAGRVEGSKSLSFPFSIKKVICILVSCSWSIHNSPYGKHQMSIAHGVLEGKTLRIKVIN